MALLAATGGAFQIEADAEIISERSEKKTGVALLIVRDRRFGPTDNEEC